MGWGREEGAEYGLGWGVVGLLAEHLFADLVVVLL